MDQRQHTGNTTTYNIVHAEAGEQTDIGEVITSR